MEGAMPPENETPPPAEPPKAPEPPETPPAAGQEPPKGTGEPADLGDAGKRALEAERAARKEAETAAKAAQKALDDLKAEQGKAEKSTEDRLAELTGKFETAERERQRLAIAAEFSIPAADHIFLTSNDPDVLRQQAEAVAAKNKALAIPSHQQIPGQGQAGGDGSLQAQIDEARRNGDAASLVRLESQKLLPIGK